MTVASPLPNKSRLRRVLRLPNFTPWEARLLLIGLGLKLLAGAFLASDFLTDMFIPFVVTFVSDPSGNPYSAFVTLGSERAFPYPAAMLYLLAFPEFVLELFAIESVIASIFAYRLVVLCADVSIYLTLRRWLSDEYAVRLAALYWLSPVAFYINYVHGQLDAIPIAFLFLSTACLFSERHGSAALFFGIAISAKTSVALIGPVFLLYYVGRPDTLPNLVRFGLGALLTVLLLNMPFLTDPAFYQMVLMNREQTKVFSLTVGTDAAQFQVVLAAWIALVALAARVGIANRSLFIMFIGFLFSVVLLLIPPMFGWYYWIIPSFAYFFAREREASPAVFFLLQAMYLLHFLVSPESDYLQVFQIITGSDLPVGSFYRWLGDQGFDTPTLFSVAFTLLQTTLLLLCVQVYRRGIRKYRIQKITGRPFLLGIGGNSGTGKSTLTEAIIGIFNKQNTTVIRGDDRHKWPRGHVQWSRLTHLNPKANYLHNEIDTLRVLKSGRKIWRRMYDHGSGTFTQSMPLIANRLMILEGLHPFYLSDQRALFDLRVFIAPEETLAAHWKVVRDKKKRNYETAQIMKQIEKRRKDVERYINTQRQFADIVVSPRADREIAPFGEGQAEFEVEYEVTLSNRIWLEPALEALAEFEELDIEHSYLDVDHQQVSIRGTCSEACREKIRSIFESRLYEIGVHKAAWPPGISAALVFILVHVIFEEARNAT